MGKLISFIFLIFFLSCGQKETTKETTTTKETVMPLSEGYNKQVDELKTKITAMSADLESSAKMSEAEKIALKNQIESLHKQQTDLEKQLEVLKKELPKTVTPKINLTSDEQKVLDWLKDKMKYGKMTIQIDKTIEEIGSPTFTAQIEFKDNYFFKVMNEGLTTWIEKEIDEPKLKDFNFIFDVTGYKIDNGKISYCDYYVSDNRICNKDSPPECTQAYIRPCKQFSAGCNLNIQNPKCFKNIILGEGNSFQFDLVPNHYVKLCEMNIIFTRQGDTEYSYGSMKNKCKLSDKLPTEIPFKLTFFVNNDGNFNIKDQNGTLFEGVTVLQLLPDKEH